MSAFSGYTRGEFNKGMYREGQTSHGPEPGRNTVQEAVRKSHSFEPSHVVNEFRKSMRLLPTCRVYLVRQNRRQRAWRDCTWVTSWGLQVYVLPDI